MNGNEGYHDRNVIPIEGSSTKLIPLESNIIEHPIMIRNTATNLPIISNENQ